MKMRLPVLLIALLGMAINASARRGDVNGDGIVNGSDVTALYNILLNGATANGEPDVSGDGNVNGSDVTALYNILLNPVDNEEELFASCYATLRCEHQVADLAMLRHLWNFNELTTDEAHCTWTDSYIPELNGNVWDKDNYELYCLFLQLCDNIDICNSYLTRTGHDDMHDAEVRVLRALYYYYMMDLWGQAPFSTTTATALTSPAKSRTELFSFIESELKAVENDLEAPRNGEYGRVDRAAAWMLLTRLYLNAEVYTGTARWEQARTYAEKVINSGYELNTTATDNFTAFQLLFLGDNDTNGAQVENIWPIVYDGNVTDYPAWIYSGTSFLVASTADSYINNGNNRTYLGNWGGNRARARFSDLFALDNASEESQYNQTPAAAGDARALFELRWHSKNITNETYFYSGYGYIKWTNFHSDNTQGTGYFVDSDFPLMRVAEAYLSFAEADARLHNGSCTATGINIVNQLRRRAGATSLNTFTLNDLLDEWGREFGFEGRRRIDLIRFGKFGGKTGYTWEWKGGSKEGRDFDPTRNVFPIPGNVLLYSNPGLTQNPGYDVQPNNVELTASSQVDFNDDERDAIFSWTASAVDGYITLPTQYTLSLYGNDNTKVVTLDAQNRLHVYLTTGQFAAMVKEIYGQEAATQVKATVTATVPGYGSVTSNEVTIALKNYIATPPSLPQLWYFTGNFTKETWTNYSSGAFMLPFYAMDEVNYSADGEGTIEYVGYFPDDAEYVIVQTPGTWDPSIRQGEEDGGFSTSYGSNNHITHGGYYRLTIKTGSWPVVSIAPYSGTVGTSYSTMYLTGDFNNWSIAATSMTPISASNNHDWECFIRFDKDAELKFVSGNVSWGNDKLGYYGTATAGESANITVPAGYYRIVFNDITGRYMFIDADTESNKYNPDAIESAYYLTGDFNNWNSTDKSYKMEPNSWGRIFTYTLPATGSDIHFKVAPESAFREGHDFMASLLCNTTAESTTATSGSFAVGTQGGDFVIPRDNNLSYTISFNMSDKTYSITGNALPSTLYVAGTGNGWGSKWMEPLVSRSNNGIYTGYVYLQDDFKIYASLGTDGASWGAGTAAGTLSAESAAGNINTGLYGYYYVTVDLNTLTYTIGKKITSVGLVGAQTGWSSDFASLTFNPSTGAWEGLVNFEADQEFKFRANQDWSYNWGGYTWDKLEEFGANLLPPGAGTYFVQLWAWAGNLGRATHTKQ